MVGQGLRGCGDAIVAVLQAEARPQPKPPAREPSSKAAAILTWPEERRERYIPAGHEQGGCCLAMTLRDVGRFGQFILDGARIGMRSVIPENWLAEATRQQVSTGPGAGYGYHWWTSDDGTFNGYGIYGQVLSAAEKPTDRAAREARQAFVAAIKGTLDVEGAEK